jgi:hydrogenase maturation protein HypF
MSAERQGLRIEVRGIVQGVGFRPFVYAQALRGGLTGWVRNTSGGVEMQVSGTPEPPAVLPERPDPRPAGPGAHRFASPASLAPPTAASFEIAHSQPRPDEFIPVSPDVSHLRRLPGRAVRPADRRYRYPFTNCTNCGPRFTIVQDMPYDRPKTTMAGFEMCPACRSEYQNPLDRRFHAQPVACPRCGPQVWLEASGQRGRGEQAIQAARKWLKQGKILAVKGLGGFHLACDACNPQAVDELRRRKQRSDKPFALMAFDLSAVEQALLCLTRGSPAAQHPPAAGLAARPPTRVERGRRCGSRAAYVGRHAGLHSSARMLLLEQSKVSPNCWS